MQSAQVSKGGRDCELGEEQSCLNFNFNINKRVAIEGAKSRLAGRSLLVLVTNDSAASLPGINLPAIQWNRDGIGGLVWEIMALCCG